VCVIEIVVRDLGRDSGDARGQGERRVNVRFGDGAGTAFGVKLPTRNVVETLGDVQEATRRVEKTFPRLGVVLEEDTTTEGSGGSCNQRRNWLVEFEASSTNMLAVAV
jgi:hypothetical protein